MIVALLATCFGIALMPSAGKSVVLALHLSYLIIMPYVSCIPSHFMSLGACGIRLHPFLTIAFSSIAVISLPLKTSC